MGLGRVDAVPSWSGSNPREKVGGWRRPWLGVGPRTCPRLPPYSRSPAVPCHTATTTTWPTPPASAEPAATGATTANISHRDAYSRIQQRGLEKPDLMLPEKCRFLITVKLLNLMI